jgi:hypothetical protein
VESSHAAGGAPVDRVSARNLAGNDGEHNWKTARNRCGIEPGRYVLTPRVKGLDDPVLDDSIFLRGHHQEQASAIAVGLPVNRAGFAAAIVAGANDLTLNVKISGQHEEFFDGCMMLTWIARGADIDHLPPPLI